MVPSTAAMHAALNDVLVTGLYLMILFSFLLSFHSKFASDESSVCLLQHVDNDGRKTVAGNVQCVLRNAMLSLLSAKDVMFYVFLTKIRIVQFVVCT